SVKAVARMVKDPPFSILRAAPKKRFGLCNAFASTPPDRIFPDAGATVLYARAKRVMESNKITTSCPHSTIRFAFSNTILRSEEHTSELQSRENLVCRLLLEKKK